MICASDGCSVTKCGHRATCTDLGGEGSCSCDIGYDGNPYSRCYPITVPQDCSCTKLTVASRGEAAATQSDKMGTYYLYGYHDDKVVYQHQSGLEFLFHAHGQAWAIGADVGGLRVGVINFSNNSCPYKVDSVWKYSTQGQLSEDASLSVTCDTRSLVQNPIRPVTEPPAVTSTSYSNHLTNQDLEQLEALLYRNYVNQPPSATEQAALDRTMTTTEPTGIFSVPTGDKGIIKVHQILEERPTKIQDLKLRTEDKIPDTFFDHLSNTLYNEDGDQLSGESYKIYLVSSTQNPNYFETNVPPSPRSPRTPSPKLRSSQLLPTAIPKRLVTTETTPNRNLQHFLNQLTVKSETKPREMHDRPSLHPAYTSLPINYDKTQGKHKHPCHAPIKHSHFQARKSSTR